MRTNVAEHLVQQLQRDRAFFETLADALTRRQGPIESKIHAAYVLAWFSAQCHVGHFTSTRIDALIDSIRMELPVILPTGAAVSHADECLFIASQIYEVGGHTRLIENIARFEKARGNRVRLLVTDQRDIPVPGRFRDPAAPFDAVVLLEESRQAEKISEVEKQLASAGWVYAVQHPDDVVTAVALHTTSRPYTFFINHADHIYWLGARQTDAIVNYRPFGAQISVHRRNANVPQIVLPVKLDLSKKIFTKEDARQQLGIPLHVPVLLTISVLNKVLPDGTYDMFRIIDEILRFAPDAVYLFIGITEADYRHVTGKEPDARLRLLGRIEDPTLYRCAADIYLEGMPWNSLMAMLESVAAGAYPIPQWGPAGEDKNVESELFIQSLVTHPKTEAAYLQAVRNALNPETASERTAIVKKIQDNIIHYNSDEYWSAALSANHATGMPADFNEFDTGEYDRSLSGLLRNQWASLGRDPYFEALRLAAGVLSLSTLARLWHRYVYRNQTLSFAAKAKMGVSLVFRKWAPTKQQ